MLCQPTDGKPTAMETTAEFLELKDNHHGFERGMNTALSCPAYTTVGLPPPVRCSGTGSHSSSTFIVASTVLR